jgi:hypothetical protein
LASVGNAAIKPITRQGMAGKIARGSGAIASLLPFLAVERKLETIDIRHQIIVGAPQLWRLLTATTIPGPVSFPISDFQPSQIDEIERAVGSRSCHQAGNSIDVAAAILFDHQWDLPASKSHVTYYARFCLSKRRGGDCSPP